MKDLFPVCKDSRRLVNELLSNDGNNVLLVPVLVFEHQQSTARSHSRRSMLAVPASTSRLPDLCLARGRTAQQAPEDAWWSGRVTNDLTDARICKDRRLPAHAFGPVMTPQSTASDRGAGAANRPSRWTRSCCTPARTDKGYGLNTPVQDLLNAADRHAPALRPTAQVRISSTF
jgi:hypothetical protein